MPNFINAPTELAGLHTWLRADQGIVLEGAGPKVEQWQDLSGNARHLIQTTNTNFKPLLIANAINGQPAIRADGVDDYLAIANIAMPMPCTAFFVYKQITLDIGVFASGNGVGCYIANSNTGPSLRCNFGSTTTAQTTGWALPVGRYHIVTCAHTGNAVTVSANGAVAAALSGTGLQTLAVFQLFASTTLARFTNAELAEVILFNRYLSPGEITMVERYLGRRYAITAQSRVPLFSASDLPGLVGWYKAGQGLGFEPGTGKIAVWNDLSGLDRHLLQATTGLRPILTDGPIGRPAVLLDGVDDYLEAAFTLAQPMTAVMVWSATGTPGVASHDIFFSGPTNNNFLYLDTSTTMAPYFGAGAPSVAKFNLGAYGVTTSVINGASSQLRNNGVLLGTGNPLGGAAGGFRVGYIAASRTAALACAEIALYNRVLTASELARLERSMGGSYGIAVA